MQREQARLRDVVGGYSGPCSVRGYIATISPTTVNFDRVYKEQCGVRISAARNVAPKVPSIRELIVQLNRKQNGDEPLLQTRPNNRLRRKSLNNLTSRLPEPSKSSRESLPPVLPSQELVIQVGDQTSIPSLNKGQPHTIGAATTNRSKLPWRLTNNYLHNKANLGDIMNIRHMASTTVNVVENETEMEEKFGDNLPLDKEIFNFSTQENVFQSEGLTDGLLICSTKQQHRNAYSDTIAKMNLIAPSLLRRSRPHSPSLNPMNSNLSNVQQRPSQKQSISESDPIYPDPLNRAPSTFHHRILEISAMVSETKRLERVKFLKKKTKAHSRQD